MLQPTLCIIRRLASALVGKDGTRIVMVFVCKHLKIVQELKTKQEFALNVNQPLPTMLSTTNAIALLILLGILQKIAVMIVQLVAIFVHLLLTVLCVNKLTSSISLVVNVTVTQLLLTIMVMAAKLFLLVQMANSTLVTKRVKIVTLVAPVVKF